MYVSRDRFVYHDRRIELEGFDAYGVGSFAAVDASRLAAELGLREGVVTTSNSLEVFRRGINPLNPLFRFLSWLVPRARIPLGLDSTKISTDESVQRAYATDPQIPPTASLRLIVEFAAACEAAREGAKSIGLPWLIVHGEEDAIAPAEGSRVLFRELASTDKQLEIYPGLRHEVHNEVPAARERFIQLLSQWILQRSAAS